MGKISIIVACENDFLSLEPVYVRVQGVFQHLNYQYELIFVDNASTDVSADLYKMIMANDGNVKAVFMPKNFESLQPVFFAGIQYATGDAVVIMEGNLQDPPEVIPDLVQKWEQGFDLVYAVRKSKDIFARDFSIMDRKVVDFTKKLEEKNLCGLRSCTDFKQAGIEYLCPEED